MARLRSRLALPPAHKQGLQGGGLQAAAMAAAMAAMAAADTAAADTAGTAAMAARLRMVAATALPLLAVGATHCNRSTMEGEVAVVEEVVEEEVEVTMAVVGIGAAVMAMVAAAVGMVALGLLYVGLGATCFKQLKEVLEIEREIAGHRGSGRTSVEQRSGRRTTAPAAHGGARS